jgi:serine/threonine protein kinase
MTDQIFISYSHSDLPFVGWLMENLKQRGYEIWLDSSAIRIGQQWREEIVQGIEESEYFMIIISSRSIKSEHVVKELSLAETYGRLILPVMIEEVEIPAKMKYQLAGVQFILLDDSKSDENLDRLVQGLQKQAVSSERDAIDSLFSQRDLELQHCIGQSELSKTFRLTDRRRKRDVVLKAYRTSEIMIEKFQAEANMLESFRYTGIPYVLDHYCKGGHYCLLQEFINGTPWSEFLWDSDTLLSRMDQLLTLIAAMHRFGVVHGNINPQNLLISTRTKQTYLVDFSLVKTALLMQQSSGVVLPNQMKGNQPALNKKKAFANDLFQAPELSRFSVLNPAVDLYALGVTILVLCSGKNPATLYEQHSGRWCMEGVDPSICRWLAPMLIDSPSERIQSADEVLDLMHSTLFPTPRPFKDEILNQAVDPLLLQASIDLTRSDQATVERGDNFECNPNQWGQDPASPSLPEACVTPSPEQEPGNLCRWSRNQLLACLLQRIGPIAKVLLQQWPDILDEGEYDAMRRHLESLGIEVSILDECMHYAKLTSATEPKAALQSSLIPVSMQISASALEWLRQQVGPVAQILWDSGLEREVQNDPGKALLRLEGLGVESKIAREFLERISSTNSENSPNLVNLPLTEVSVSATPPVLEASEQTQDATISIEEAELLKHQLKLILRDILGPIGDSILQEFSAVPCVNQQALKILERLRQLKLGEELLQKIEIQLRPFLQI